MKLAKAKPIIFEHPVIVNYIAGGVFKNLYEKHKNKPGLLVKVLAETKDFINHIQSGIAFLLIKSLSRLNLDVEPDESTKYYINFFLLKKNRKTGDLEKETIDWVEVPDNFTVEEFLENIRFARTKENQFFLLDSIVRKQILRKNLDIKNSYEVFVLKEALKSSKIIDEEI